MIGEVEKSQNPSQPAGNNKCALMWSETSLSTCDLPFLFARDVSVNSASQTLPSTWRRLWNTMRHPPYFWTIRAPHEFKSLCQSPWHNVHLLYYTLSAPDVPLILNITGKRHHLLASCRPLSLSTFFNVFFPNSWWILGGLFIAWIMSFRAVLGIMDTMHRVMNCCSSFWDKLSSSKMFQTTYIVASTEYSLLEI